MSMEIPPWTNTKDTCKLFGVGRQWLQKARDKGLIRGKKLGDAKQAGVVYRTSDLVEYLEKQDATDESVTA